MRYGCSGLNITLVSILLNILSSISCSISFFFDNFYLCISSKSNLFFILKTSFLIYEFIFSSSSSLRFISSNNNFLTSVLLHFFRIFSFFKYSLILILVIESDCNLLRILFLECWIFLWKSSFNPSTMFNLFFLGSSL